MTSYTFTDDAGTHEHHEHADDAEAIQAAEKWAASGLYPYDVEISVWQGDRLVKAWTIEPTTDEQ